MNSHKRFPASLSAIKVLFEDDTILVLDKPSGLLVLPDRYDPSIPNLKSLLEEDRGQIYVVHRIDRETSGVIIFAKTEESHRSLNSQFESRATEKEYLAICRGDAQNPEGDVDLPLSEDRAKRGKMRVDRTDGKKAITKYSVVEQFNRFTLIEAEPRTGRTHQIRVHLSAVDLPILGDSLYGGGKGFFLSEIKPVYRKKAEEKPLLDRTALHAFRISINHPTTNQRISFEADLPKDMRIVLNYLRKFRGR